MNYLLGRIENAKRAWQLAGKVTANYEIKLGPRAILGTTR
jgi:hypothetical protein